MSLLVRMIKNLVLLGVSVIISLLIAEVIVRNFVVVRNVGPTLTQYDPYFGKTHKTNFSGTRVGPDFKMDFNLNSDGFRGPELEQTVSNTILFLGDSFTFGYGVNDSEAFPALVQTELGEDVQVINAGMGNNANGRWIRFLKKRAYEYDPKYVVLQIHYNDYWGNFMEGFYSVSSADELLEKLPPPKSKARKLQSMIDRLRIFDNSYLMGFAMQVAFPVGALESESAKDNYLVKKDRQNELLLRLFNETLELCDQQGREVIALLLVGVDGQRYDDLHAITKARDIPIIQVPDKKQRPDLYFEIDGHWNAAGHQVASEKLLEEFRARIAN